MESDTTAAPRRSVLDSIKPYLEKESIAAFLLGLSSGYPFALLAATLTTRLAQDGIEKSTITAFTLAFFVYNFKPLWAWVIDGLHIPVLGRLGQRVAWMLVTGVLVIAATVNLALVNPAQDIGGTVAAAVLLGLAGASFDIVIDAYRIETLKPYQLGVGSGMSQYGWRIGSAGAGSLALVVAARSDWHWAYAICAVFALPAILTALVLGEPPRHKVSHERRGMTEIWASIAGPFVEFFQRSGAWLVLAFILVHKIGDTLANLTFRLLFDDLGFSNDEIAIYDVGVGFWALIVGVFVGGVIYARLGLKRSVLIALVLMAISNLSFAMLAAAGHSNWGMAAAIGFENFASGYGGVVVVAYFSALCDLRFTAAQYALISAGASAVGRLLTGTTAGALIEAMGYVNFYLLTTIAALPGIALFWWMMRTGLVDAAMGTAGEVGEGDARADPA
ncbi:MFS transporter [Novosphingobium sp. PC22D]|uniref:AmpG family muropeptide MFS transporter n=1 Tax=Novosphingobium sp. PC22D TaxID=1962403 RepID=UPI000BEFB8BA|nr:MFS transporter [Novosphingobium sp. PC22D]PEQ13168.1 MFS transporter [Novosphingobium sp. PC22D]